jgi:ubiquinone/menaquinone biosynthesis C-methylase UbiE
MKPDTSSSVRVLDYDGAGNATYRQDFWEGQGREYEDRVERIALGRLLQPATGQRLLELGAGFGRLSSFYTGYKQVILVDYAKSQLEEARAGLGDGKYIYVAANIYQLPFADASCDAAVMVRVLHHFADVPAALRQIRPALAPGAVFILEFANKRNLKAILRHLLGRQSWSPYTLDPVEFLNLHFDFHPQYIRAVLQEADFQLQRSLAVSYLRLGFLKRLLPTSLLVRMDSWLQLSGWLYSPSVFIQNTIAGSRPDRLPDNLFKCPACQHSDLTEDGEVLTCQQCGKGWSKAGGIYDFRQPVE